MPSVGVSLRRGCGRGGNAAARAPPVPRTLWGGLPAGVLHAPAFELASGDQASLIISWSAASSETSSCVNANHVLLSSSDAHPPLKPSISTYRH
jgi:hypothetical protein